MGEEAVLAVTALAGPRIEGVDVDVAPVAVERSAVAGRLEPVDADAVVGEPPELVPVLAVRPVLEDVELRKRAAPVGEKSSFSPPVPPKFCLSRTQDCSAK
jgi:hypothetical protein